MVAVNYKTKIDNNYVNGRSSEGIQARGNYLARYLTGKEQIEADRDYGGKTMASDFNRVGMTGFIYGQARPMDLSIYEPKEDDPRRGSNGMIDDRAPLF